jgi:hypothetical protein
MLTDSVVLRDLASTVVIGAEVAVGSLVGAGVVAVAVDIGRRRC